MYKSDRLLGYDRSAFMCGVSQCDANEKYMKNTSKPDWKRVNALREEDIDTSDIPPLGKEFMETSRW